MTRTLAIVLTAFLFVSFGAVAGTEYGSGVTLAQTSSISDLIAKPDAYTGKTVTVTGRVVDVCAHRGCWMDLAGGKPGETIRVKVEDGVIVFPALARGRRATVQGTVEMMNLCPEEASALGKGRALAIRATGAVIE